VLTGLGHGLGVGLYAFAAVVGIAAVIAATPGAARMVELVGGLVLLWMGVAVLRHAGDGGLGAPTSGRVGFAEGFTIAFLNPKIAVFFLALLGSMLPADATPLDRAGVAGLAMCIDAGWYVFAALVLATTGAAEWLADRGVWVDRLLGGLLLTLGVWLVATSIG
jgi:threonine/homoserine/homoserine lactone efflux protein